MIIKKPEDFQYLSDKLDRVLHDILKKVNTPILGKKNVGDNFTVTDESFLGVDTKNGAVTITLPAPSDYENKFLIIKDEGGLAGTNNITVAFSTGSDYNIDGSSTATISANYGALSLYATNLEWFSF